MKSIPVLFIIAALTAACSSAAVKNEHKAAAEDIARPAQSPSRVEQKIAPRPAGAGAVAAVDPLDDPNSLLAKRSVYYDYDKSGVRQEFQPVIQAHAGYLASHHAAKVRIEGSCDERGSREYNLALGQRRADAVKAELKLLGVADDQSETVSWGEEKPKAAGHDEAAWAQNRRSDLVYGALHK